MHTLFFDVKPLPGKKPKKGPEDPLECGKSATNAPKNGTLAAAKH